MGWEYIVLLIYVVLLAAASFFLRSSPKQQQRQPGNPDIPTSEKGSPIRVVWGDMLVKPLYVFWWGDTEVQVIKAKGGKK